MNQSTSMLSTLGALAGVAFAFFFFGSVFIFDPLREATDQEILDHWSDTGKLRDNIISMYFLVIAAPLFFVFLAGLCKRLRSAGELGESWTGVVFGAGVAFTALLTVTAVSRGVIAQSVRFTDEPLPGVDTLRYATALSQAAFAMGAVPLVTVAIAVASAIVIRTGVLARWLGWLGLVVTAGSLALIGLMAGAFAIPLITLWTVAASFLLWRTRNAVASENAGRPAIGSVVASR